MQANLIFNQGMDVMDNHKDRPSTSDVSAAMDHMSMDVDLPKDDGFGTGTGTQNCLIFRRNASDGILKYVF